MASCNGAIFQFLFIIPFQGKVRKTVWKHHNLEWFFLSQFFPSPHFFISWPIFSFFSYFWGERSIFQGHITLFRDLISIFVIFLRGWNTFPSLPYFISCFPISLWGRRVRWEDRSPINLNIDTIACFRFLLNVHFVSLTNDLFPIKNR